MTTFNTIVSICSGSSVIIALLVMVIRPIRERITHSKEREEKIQKNFEDLKADIQAVGEKLVCLDEKVDENEAIRSRIQILRFDSEMYEGRLHTKEHFDEILDQCDLYNNYCATHPEFKNQRTLAAQRHINNVYDWCKENHKFLDTMKGMKESEGG